MEKIFKKSLALMVSAALCLTAFVGCLTVNAEGTATPTYTITAQNGKAGDTVTVNVDGTNLTSVCGQQVFINIPAALTIASVKDNAGNPYINVANVTEGEAFDYNVVTTETTKQVRFADIINFDTLTTAEFHIVFELTIPEAAEVGAKYEIAFDTATMFADINENAIGITVTPATITVQAAGPVVDDALVIAGASLGYGTSSLQMTFRMRKTVIELATYDHVNLVISAQKYDTTTFNLVDPTEIVVAKADMKAAGSFYTYVYSDIQLYELGLNLTYMLKAYDAEGNCVATSAETTTSPANYLKSLYASSSDELLLTAITDTLVVGNESKLLFQKAGSDLESAASIIEGFDISKATPSVNSYNTVNTHNATNAAWGTESTCAHQARISASIGKAPYLSYRIKGASSLDISKLSFTVSYTQTTGKGTTAEYSKTFTSADSAHLAVAGSFITFKFDEIGLLDGARDITFVATYDGAEVFNSVYSVETYLGANTANATIGALATALLKLGVSCRAYFG